VTLFLHIEYDGTNYGGWQFQLNSVTVQEILEKALEKITGCHLNVIGSGRTDAGVHSRGQVASVIVDDDFTIPVEKIPIAINSLLPHDIRIRNACIVEGNHNARFEAVAREYSYTITQIESVFTRNFAALFKYKFDVDLMKRLANSFIGSYDFTTLSKLNTSTKSYICNISLSEWEENNGFLIYHVKSDRFVYGMVRALVGAMIDVGRGKRTIEDILKSFEKKDRALSSPAAPANGLVLEKIYYPLELGLFK
jgi:tRNA pseudouridine38-40 synthase